MRKRTLYRGISLGVLIILFLGVGVSGLFGSLLDRVSAHSAPSGVSSPPALRESNWTFKYSADGGQVIVTAGLHGQYSVPDPAHPNQPTFTYTDQQPAGTAYYQLDLNDWSNKVFGVSSVQSPFAECTFRSSIYRIYSFVPVGGTSIQDASKAISQNGILNTIQAHKILPAKQSKYSVITCSPSPDTDAFGMFYINISGSKDSGVGGGGGTSTWNDTEGKTVDANQTSLKRFVFVSPSDLVDTNSHYADGKPVRYHSSLDGMFASDVNDRFKNDGIQVYWPINEDGSSWEKNDAGTCNGGFTVKSGDGSKYGSIYMVPTHLTTGSCYFGESSAVGGYKGHLGPGYPSGLDDEDYNVSTQMGPKGNEPAVKLWYASLFWNTSDQIYTYTTSGGQSLPLTRLADDKAKTILSQVGESDQSTQLWTTAACSSQSGAFYPFISIHYDGTSNLTDLNTDSSNATAIIYIPNGTGWSKSWNGDKASCLFGHEIKSNNGRSISFGSTLFLANVAKSVNNTSAATDPTTYTPPASSSSSVEDISCDVSIFNPLTWLVCPIFTAARDAVGQLDNAITHRLTIDSGQLLSNINDPNDPAYAFYKAWSGFRTIAMTLLVVIALVMVISQAISVGPIDAYTVRKVLPRLLIAVIFISISWYVMKFMVDLTNDIGNATKVAIETPFSALPNFQLKSSAITGAGLLVGVGLLGLGLIGILSFAATALLAVLIAFVILTLREMVVLMLIILAPIAIVAYILPGTEKAWKLWWESFSKALLMFPIIMGFIAIGHAFAAVVYTAGGGDLLSQIIAMVAYFGPYFAIPATVRLAGGALANIGGVINDRGRGVFDRLSKYRGNKTAQNVQAIKEGRRVEGRDYIPGSRGLARGFNRTTVGLGTGMRGNFGFGTRGNQAVHQALETAAMERMKTTGFQSIANNDGALKAATYDSVQEAKAAGVSDADIGAAQAAGYKFGDRSFQMAATRAMFSTATAFDNGRDAAETIRRVAHGNAASANALAGFGNSEAKKVGRHDWSPGYATLSAIGRGERQWDASSDAEAWRSGGLYQLASGKPKALEQFANHWTGIYRNANATQAQRQEAATALLEMQNMLPNANGENQNTINAALNLVGINHGSGQPVAEQLGATVGLSGAELTGRARVYDRDSSNAQNQGQVQPSDVRFKRDISYLYTDSAGVPLYRFKYLWDTKEYVGVMAQDILRIHPEAVVVDRKGYYSVNYDVLGVRLQSYKEWEY